MGSQTTPRVLSSSRRRAAPQAAAESPVCGFWSPHTAGSLSSGHTLGIRSLRCSRPSPVPQMRGCNLAPKKLLKKTSRSRACQDLGRRTKPPGAAVVGTEHLQRPSRAPAAPRLQAKGRSCPGPSVGCSCASSELLLHEHTHRQQQQARAQAQHSLCAPTSTWPSQAELRGTGLFVQTASADLPWL